MNIDEREWSEQGIYRVSKARENTTLILAEWTDRLGKNKQYYKDFSAMYKDLRVRLGSSTALIPLTFFSAKQKLARMDKKDKEGHPFIMLSDELKVTKIPVWNRKMKYWIKSSGKPVEGSEVKMLAKKWRAK